MISTYSYPDWGWSESGSDSLHQKMMKHKEGGGDGVGGLRYIVTPGQNSVTKFGKINCPNLCDVIYESVIVLICMKVKFNSSQ